MYSTAALVFSTLLLFVLGQSVKGDVFTCENSTTYCILNSCRECPTSRPFCSNDTQSCTANNPSTILSCPRDGVFPSLDSCRSYTLCLGDSRQIVTCPTGSVFDPAIRGCKRGRPCYRFICRRSDEGSYIPYPGDSSFYALCSDGMAVYLRECGTGQIFDQTSGRCKQYCPGIGDFVDLNTTPKCQCFYSCTGIGVNQGVHSCCGANEYFSPTVGQCVSSSNTKRPYLCS